MHWIVTSIVTFQLKLGLVVQRDQRGNVPRNKLAGVVANDVNVYAA